MSLTTWNVFPCGHLWLGRCTKKLSNVSYNVAAHLLLFFAYVCPSVCLFAGLCSFSLSDYMNDLLHVLLKTRREGEGDSSAISQHTTQFCCCCGCWRKIGKILGKKEPTQCVRACLHTYVRACTLWQMNLSVVTSINFLEEKTLWRHILKV